LVWVFIQKWISGFSANYGCSIIPTANSNTLQNHCAFSIPQLENYPKSIWNAEY